MSPLIICRGPIRIEAMTVFDEMGINHYGILLSEKDSITYANALSPELRKGLREDRVHRIPDYTGATKEERVERINDIIGITHTHGYNAVFAGYGFMAEDETLVSALEDAGLNFIGPCSRTDRSAGNTHLAKRTAIAEDVSATPGVDNATELTMERLYPDVAALRSLASDHKLNVDVASMDFHTAVSAVLDASYAKGVDLFSIDDLSETLTTCVADLMQRHPEYRIRLKAIGGGGGKGQRILDAPVDSRPESVESAAARVDTLFREILSEVRAGGVGDNKNVLAELNIETVRHVEIQVVGNGDWCITMGGRDCSVQMNEQKLLELSLTVPEIEDAISAAGTRGEDEAVVALQQDLETLKSMEDEASRFGAAVGLDSVSTFECIVDQGNHFFMEMNTRVQVEHRVSELCYSLRFTNPDDPDDFLDVDAIIELMVLLARHGDRLPRPERQRREGAAAEIRLNASDDALKPHAGGVITDWSPTLEGEIRDDQGICLTNPDTDMFMRYHLAGAYDSNIALELTTGNSRDETFERATTILRKMKISGENLSTNLSFHYGLVNWFGGQNIQARPATNFALPYLTAVGQLARCSADMDLTYAWGQIVQQCLSMAADDSHKGAVSDVMARKSNLVIRAIANLLDQPHYLAGWLSRHRGDFAAVDGNVTWYKNRLFVLQSIYEFLNMLPDINTPPLYAIWPEDLEILETGLSFYHDLSAQGLTSDDGQLTAEATDNVVGADHGLFSGL
ncbi:MAG: biotin carboxylase N-terminal domain-containing protein [Pseudomonadota bacterium]